MDAVAEFLRLHLTELGGVVEGDGAALEALLPPEAAAGLGVDEDVRLAVGGAPEGGAVDARLGSPLLERAVAACRARPPLAGVALPGELPRSLPENLPVLLNAVRSDAAGPRTRAPARYLLAHLRLSLQADEVRHALSEVAVRLEDGACVPALALAGAYPAAVAPLDEGERTAAGRALRAAFGRVAPALLGGALAAIGRRAQRDLLRMADYFTSLDGEMARAIERARAEDERGRRAAKRALLPAELEARRGQLRDRLAARLGAELVAATIVETEVDRWEIPVRRRVRAATVVVRRRAGDGVIEGPACAACGESTLRLHLCDDRLHPLCEGCGHTGRLDAPRCPGCRPRAGTPLVVTVADPTAALRVGGAGREVPPTAPS